MSKSVAIAGMGWVGVPLAQRLQILGYNVKGTVTSEEKAKTLRNSGFHALVVEISENGVSGDISLLLAEADYLVVMIPPGLRRYSGADYVLKMSHFLSEIEKTDVKKVILVSSISVYSDSQGMVTEHDLPKPDTQAGKQLLQVEQLFFNSDKLHTTIVRFGGLYGGSRQPVRYLAGRKELSNGDAPVNLIHRADCVAILSEIIKQDAFGHVFNAVIPEHPKKRDYYRDTAIAMNLDSPSYLEENSEESYKQVDSVQLEQILGYSFKRTL